MGVQIHTSGPRGGHGGPDTRHGSRGSGESRYTTVDLEGVTRVKIHATKSTGSHEGPYTRQ